MYYTDFWHISADNTFRVPGYKRFDMAFFHDVGRRRSSVFIENFTDERYVAGANGSTTIAPGAPPQVPNYPICYGDEFFVSLRNTAFKHKRYNDLFRFISFHTHPFVRASRTNPMPNNDNLCD